MISLACCSFSCTASSCDRILPHHAPFCIERQLPDSTDNRWPLSYGHSSRNVPLFQLCCSLRMVGGNWSTDTLALVPVHGIEYELEIERKIHGWTNKMLSFSIVCC